MFSGMVGWDQWIVWEIQERNGLTTKVPISRVNRLPSDSQDPATWSSYAQAVADAQQLGVGVGFVFTEADPFFFVDVDHALVGGAWSDTALWARALFPGAAFEVSYSGDGFHLFGRYGAIAPHSNKRADAGLEFYTSGRFCACTFTQAEPGDDRDLTVQANQFAAYFPPKPKADPIAWTTGPDPDWNGPANDGDLLAKFFAQKPNAIAAFQGGANNRQLWEGDEGPLCVSFPGDPYGRNEADLSLARKLAFWTGKDCARIERLMTLAPLCDRDKWRDRPDYRERTIGVAVAGCSEVYASIRVADAVDPINDLPAEALVADVGVAAPSMGLLSLDLQREKFAGCVYVADRNRILTPSGDFYTEKVFRSMYGGYTFLLDWDAGKTTNAWEAFVESRVNVPPRAGSSTFRPRDLPGRIYHEQGRVLVNSYVPAVIDSEPGDVSPMIDLLTRMFPDPRDREVVISNGAATVQNPGVKFQWAIVIQGCEGNGKSLWARALANAIGERYSHFPNAQDLGNKFNAWIAEKLFICVEEIRQAGREDVTETLKPMITNARIEIQAKGADQITGDNCANFLFNTNYKDAVRKTLDDRRYCIVHSAQQCRADLERDGMAGDYFPNLWKWFNDGGHRYVSHWLRTYQVAAEFDPAGSCHRAPDTSSTVEAIVASRPETEQRILEAIAEGVVGFRGGWVSSVALSMLFERERVGHKERKAAVLSLGLAPHPGLHEGRATTPLTVDGSRKPTLYVMPGSIQCNLTGSAVGDAYQKAQNKTDVEVEAWSSNSGGTTGA